MLKFNKLNRLREIFEQLITISIIAEDFVAFDTQEDVDKCLAYCEENNFDVIGVSENGCVIGYAQLSKQDTGLLGEHKIVFQEDEVVTSNAPLPEALHQLSKKTHVFVKEEETSQIVGIITRADLYKPIFRMWLYGLVSVLEIHMFELIRRLYPGDEWQDNLKEDRKANIVKTYDYRRQHNEEIDLLYCTEFCDKRTIIEKSELVLKATGCKSKAEFSKTLKDIETIRNEIAHSCKVSKQRWTVISELCMQAEFIISNIELFLKMYNTN